VESTPIWYVTSFYRFIPLSDEQVPALREAIESWMTARGVLGLVLVAPEGVNGTVASLSLAAINDFKSFISSAVSVELRFKDSTSEVKPFRRVTVDRRTEIVGLKRPDVVPTSEEDHHLSPSEWHEWITSDRPHLLIDTRNRYETLAGKFQGAVDPDLQTFSEWSSYLDEHELPRDVPVLMYCTGGIRCEKASAYMLHHGFKNVFHLEGGIINYAQQVKEEGMESQFIGKNFVFDDRLGERITNDVIARCHQCGKPADTHTNCKNEACHLLFIQCEACAAAYAGCCSKECHDTVLLPEEEQKLLRKGKDKGSNIFNKSRSRLRPKLGTD